MVQPRSPLARLAISFAATACLAVVALITTAPGLQSAPTDAAPEPLAGPTPLRALGRLAVIPVVATPVFALLTSAPDPIPTGWLFYGVTVPLAAVLFVLAWVGARRRRFEI